MAIIINIVVEQQKFSSCSSHDKEHNNIIMGMHVPCISRLLPDAEML